MYSHARYQAHKYTLHNSAVDLTGSPADILAIPCIWPAVRFLYLGLIAQAAFPAAVTMTTVPVVSLDKVQVSDGERVQMGTVSPDYSQADNVVKQTDLNSNASDIHAIGDWPTALVGDEIILEHKTAGVGGTQSAKLFYIFQEIETEDADANV